MAKYACQSWIKWCLLLSFTDTGLSADAWGRKIVAGMLVRQQAASAPYCTAALASEAVTGLITRESDEREHLEQGSSASGEPSLGGAATAGNSPPELVNDDSDPSVNYLPRCISKLMDVIK